MKIENGGLACAPILNSHFPSSFRQTLANANFSLFCRILYPKAESYAIIILIWHDIFSDIFCIENAKKRRNPILSRLTIPTPAAAQGVIDALYADLGRRLQSNAVGVCPVDLCSAFVKLCHSQSCGKCTPCRIGLGQLERLLEQLLDGDAGDGTLELIEKTARVISLTADCAIGYEAANMVLRSLKANRADYEAHLAGNCTAHFDAPVPCVTLCPANVDIPGYIALVRAGRYADAVRLIRKDNPFPSACALVCEHPCESHCRRRLLDDAVNIRGLKRMAVDNAGDVPVPESAPATGKKVAVIGGGPSGLTAAYYLALMGHAVTVFEKRKQLGGMLRYGIPSYRLPRETLDAEIKSILSAGVTARTGVDIGTDVTFPQLKADYDAVYISIGAHTDNKLGIEGESGKGVISAVQMLRAIGDGDMPEFKGKDVIIVGGGNVAMDCTRSAMRLGAKSVTCVYRRRKEDMTALPEEVEGAIAEGCEVMELAAPVSVELDDAGAVKGLWVQPQMISNISRGRPAPIKADADKQLLKADIIVVAIGQAIESEHFAANGIETKWGRIVADMDTFVKDNDGVFAGGDCVTGPATAIRAIAAGKVAAANIDRYLGFDHKIGAGVDIPAPPLSPQPPCGRINLPERPAEERRHDFNLMEYPMTLQQAAQEAARCLRCDHFGFGALKGGRTWQW